MIRPDCASRAAAAKVVASGASADSTESDCRVVAAWRVLSGAVVTSAEVDCRPTADTASRTMAMVRVDTVPSGDPTGTARTADTVRKDVVHIGAATSFLMNPTTVRALVADRAEEVGTPRTPATERTEVAVRSESPVPVPLGDNRSSLTAASGVPPATAIRSTPTDMVLLPVSAADAGTTRTEVTERDETATNGAAAKVLRTSPADSAEAEDRATPDTARRVAPTLSADAAVMLL